MRDFRFIAAFAMCAGSVLMADPLPDYVSSAGVKIVVPVKARPFSLHDVRLLDGPFKAGQEIAAKYLLSLDPDRLLANFRKEAGLEPKAPHYGGWESQTICGHSLGHYLSACAIAYASTDNAEFLRRVNYIVEELAECQRAHGDGYVAAIPGGKKVFAEIAAGNIRSAPFDLNGLWVPNYTMHKLFAGLRDAYRLCNNQKALVVSRKLADWFGKIYSGLNDEQMQRVLACEHGGMNEVLADLYADTGEIRYLDLSRKFHHKAILEPLARGQDILPGKHANTQIPKLIGLATRYELTGDIDDRAAAEFFWDRVVHHHSYVTGGHCDAEHFGLPDRLNNRLSPATTETCNVYNMLKLTRHIFCWSGKAETADFYERALLNHIRATQHPDGRVIYNLSLQPGHYKEYQTLTESFTCCVGTGMENHVKYGESIYYHDTDGLWVNLFISSELTWKAKGVTLRQESQWPDGDTATLVITTETPQQFALRLRHPFWAEVMHVKLNDALVSDSTSPSSYCVLRRKWRSGDRIEVRFPFALRLESMPDNPNRVAVFYGSTLLAADLGPVQDSEADKPGYVPVLVTAGRPVVDWVKPVDAARLIFRTDGVGRPRDVQLVPFHRLHDRRYTVYLDCYSASEWAQREAEIQAELERLRRIEARTVDVFMPGDAQSEQDHGVHGEKSDPIVALGRRLRHAYDGGWFSFEMKVSPEMRNELLCTWWGSETGLRTFDILVDGVKIATQTLLNNNPGKFWDAVYPIPLELTQGKRKVVVKLQAHPGNFAGGLFGCRMLTTER